VKDYCVKFLRFAGVGSIGFVIDATTMFILSFYIAAVPARGLAFWVAASANWWLNRQFTFAAQESGKPVRQWGRFIVASCIGFIPNWGCYWILMQVVDIKILFSEFESAEHLIQVLWPFVAMVPGILLGMLTNYRLADSWVFKPV